ncbi:uncharacterized protein BDZ99DRAFT_212642 [Mytilinidion resinicola]|uniref:Uncharacterized protein n=1 Tax=Mytilinidion resinicola TaxID=574789 RepID=A0A6A6XZK9_9PEZI|nr:uncharacterized protein BDZ99DRAFT_212642 [Mytilinidion resinicola]KAF2802006.1 hypothetical protein BDZ99DRAFT_212642 [Mytilinidion resinicola]
MGRTDFGRDLGPDRRKHVKLIFSACICTYNPRLRHALPWMTSKSAKIGSLFVERVRKSLDLVEPIIPLNPRHS